MRTFSFEARITFQNSLRIGRIKSGLSRRLGAFGGCYQFCYGIRMARTWTNRLNLRIAAHFLLACYLQPAHAAQTVRTVVDLSEQRMHLYVDGNLQATWKVSTARRGYRTPVGSFRPIRLERYWRSRKYDMAPMPHSVFFLGGYAIHGTNEIRRLGRPVSHGCIRLHPRNAAHLFQMIRQAGRQNVRIVIRR